jgi:hypothetical protein
MVRRGGIESMSEFALIELLETGESMNYGESRETFERIIAAKRGAREKREADVLEQKLQFSQSPAGLLRAAQRLQAEEMRVESEQFAADLQAAGRMTPELKLRAAAGKAKAKAFLAEMKARSDEQTNLARAQRAAHKAEIEKNRAALKDDPGPRG